MSILSRRKKERGSPQQWSCWDDPSGIWLNMLIEGGRTQTHLTSREQLCSLKACNWVTCVSHWLSNKDDLLVGSEGGNRNSLELFLPVRWRPSWKGFMGPKGPWFHILFVVHKTAESFGKKCLLLLALCLQPPEVSFNTWLKPELCCALHVGLITYMIKKPWGG